MPRMRLEHLTLLAHVRIINKKSRRLAGFFLFRLCLYLLLSFIGFYFGIFCLFVLFLHTDVSSWQSIFQSLLGHLNVLLHVGRCIPVFVLHIFLNADPGLCQEQGHLDLR